MIGLLKEDSAFGPGMMFGIRGPGPSKDTKRVKSNLKKIEPKNMKKHIPKFDEFVNEQEVYESYANIARSAAIFLLSDPRIRTAAYNLASEIVGKGLNQALSYAEKKLGSNLQRTPSREEVEYDNDVINNEDDAKEFVSSYMASSVVKPEETTNIPKKKLSDITADLKLYIKDKLNDLRK